MEHREGLDIRDGLYVLLKLLGDLGECQVMLFEVLVLQLAPRGCRATTRPFKFVSAQSTSF